ncbi:MAG: cyanophycinase [Planctomycetaceae bacterium]
MPCIRLFTLVLLLAPAAPADDLLVSVKRVPPRGIAGTLVIAGGGKLPVAVRRRFLQLAGGEKARLIVIPTASTRAGGDDGDERFLNSWKTLKPASLTLLHTRNRKTANDPKFLAPLKTATAVWFSGGSQSRIAAAYVGTAVERELLALLKRGGVIGGTSAGAAVMTRVMIARGNPRAELGKGFNFLPDAVVDQHFTHRKRKSRLQAVLKKHSARFGLGIDEQTAVIVRGRRLIVVGNGNATIILAANGHIPAKEIVLKPNQLADLTAWRRAAIARSLSPFPSKRAAVPSVPRGSLVIVGGGGMTRRIARRFVELAGGRDAPIVYLPTAVPDRVARRARVPAFLRSVGATNVTVLPQSRLKDVESPAFLAVLKKARGVWFGGGRQWRFIDAYAGTKAYPLLHDVLKRGGVIGGSSAGASIQGGYLARANPLGNRDIMADGYERGLNFLPGVAIDQHFAQRRRFADMTQLMKTYPQLLGIGLDEATAIIVQKHIAVVMGRGRVHFYDRRKPVVSGKKDHESLDAGDRYDLKSRRALYRPPVAAKRPAA